MSAPMKIDPVELERMWLDGALLREVAAVFGVTEAAVCKAGKALGLRRNEMRAAAADKSKGSTAALPHRGDTHV